MLLDGVSSRIMGWVTCATSPAFAKDVSRVHPLPAKHPAAEPSGMPSRDPQPQTYKGTDLTKTFTASGM